MLKMIKQLPDFRLRVCDSQTFESEKGPSSNNTHRHIYASVATSDPPSLKS